MLFIPTFEKIFSNGNPKDLCTAIQAGFSEDPNFSKIQDLCDFVLLPAAEMPKNLVLSGPDSAFLQNIALIKKNQASKQAHVELVSSMPKCDATYDFLGVATKIEEYSILRLLNFLMMSALNSNQTTAAVVVNMRDDGLSILEWVAHYRAIGFQRIFIYSNDNIDGSTALLEKLHSAGLISYIENVMEQAVSPQMKTFEYSINFLQALRSCEWVFFVDSDEFFLPPEGTNYNVVKLLGSLREKFQNEPLPSAILYYWKWVVSGNRFGYVPDLLCKRFQYSGPNTHFKPLVRLENVRSMANPHFPELKCQGFFVDPQFKKCTVVPKVGEDNQRPDYEGGQLNHYWTKSFEEWYLKKNRGDTLKLQNSSYQRRFETFFEWNGMEHPRHYDPVPSALVKMVEAEIGTLRTIPGVPETFDCIVSKFESLVRDPNLKLREKYDSILARHSGTL